jgi:type I restriction enzyme M protein
MTQKLQNDLGKMLWNIANELRGSMNADDFRDYMLSFLFLKYYQTITKMRLNVN